MYIYLVCLVIGAVSTSLSLLAFYMKMKQTDLKKLLQFNCVFFAYMIVNFILFFNRQFSKTAGVQYVLIILFDILYIIVIFKFIGYLEMKANDRDARKYKIIFCAGGGIYVIMWAYIYFFGLGENERVMLTDMAFAAELILFVITCLCLIPGMWNVIKKSGKNEVYCEVQAAGIVLYSLWVFIYDTDLIFGFINPRLWKLYPLDGVMVLSLIINVSSAVFLLKKLCSHSDKELYEQGRLCDAIAEMSEEHGLTSREREILEDIFRGRNNSEIADHFVISIHTVKRHINNINHKTGNCNREQIIEMIGEYMK